MRKIIKSIGLILLVCLTFLLNGCDSSYSNFQYRTQKENLEYGCFYEIKSVSELEKIQKYVYEEKIGKYDDKYFKNKGLVVFVIIYPTSPSEYEIKTKSLENGILELDVVTVKEGIDLAIDEWIVCYEISLKKLDELTTIKITQNMKYQENIQRELKVYKSK